MRTLKLCNKNIGHRGRLRKQRRYISITSQAEKQNPPFCLCARGTAISLFRPVIHSKIKIDFVALNWVAHERIKI